MKDIIDIPNSEMPVAMRIRDALGRLSPGHRAELLEKMSETEFIEFRVGIFLDQLEAALLSNEHTPAGAEEIAYHECMAGLGE